MIHPDVLCVGEALVQVSPAHGERLADTRLALVSMGGAEANVAVGLARRGRVTAWAGHLGDDPLGDGIVAQLEAAGVDVSLVERRADAPTGVYFKDPDPNGSRPYYYRAGSAASRMDRAAARTLAQHARPRVVHLSGISAVLSGSAADFVDAIVVDRVFDDTLVSFDVNYRPSLATDRTPGELARLARHADIVFVGRDEAETLWGTPRADDIRAHLGDHGILIVKDGDREAVAFTGSERVRVPAHAVSVVEPTGAGDAFAAGWLDAWLGGGTLESALAAGHELAARALTTRHDVPVPEEEEAR